MKYIKIIAVCVGIIIIVGAVFLWWFGNSMCGEKTYNEKPSPDSSFIASHQMIDCGATTNHATSVFVDKDNFLFPKINVFALDGYYDKEEISLSWVDQNKLRIDYKGRITDIRKIALNAIGVKVAIYVDNEELTLQRIQEIENLIINEQASYGISLLQGEHWIEVLQ